MYVLVLPALVVMVAAVWGRWGGDNLDTFSRQSGDQRRHLMSGTGSCPELSEFQKNGGIVLYIAGVLFVFLGIAIVCDDFFVPSLEAISENLSLSEDVAGATFMAAGSSAPELFSSLMSLVSANSGNELGVGAIVGSAVFNILVIVGGTAIAAGKTLDIDWKPLLRDCGFYACSIGTTLIFFLDSKVYWWEGGIGVICYCIYVAFMFHNARIMKGLDAWEQRTFPAAHARRLANKETSAADTTEYITKNITEGETGEPVTESVSIRVGPSRNTQVAPMVGKLTESNKVGAVCEAFASPSKDGGPVSPVGIDKMVEDHEAGEGEDKEEEEDSSPFRAPDSLKDYPLWVLSLPWYAAFTLTIPPCAEEKWASYYMLSFFMSILWIAGISWGMVDWTAMIGCILDIPAVVMGVTVLAAGTSIPDAMSSFVVAKQGLGNMAVANAVGSNVFDIWLGLGLPWLCYLPYCCNGVQELETGQLLPNILILGGVLILYVVCIALAGFKLTVTVGQVFMVLYFVYVGYMVGLVWIADIYSLESTSPPPPGQ